MGIVAGLMEKTILEWLSWLKKGRSPSSCYF